MSIGPDIASVAEAFARMAALMRGDVPGDVPYSTADLMADRFDLGPFERDVLVLAAYAEMEPDGMAAIATVRGVPEPTPPDVALALAHLPGAHWGAFAPEGPLRRHRLIRLGLSEQSTQRTIMLPESVLNFLVGVPGLSEDVAVLARRVLPVGIATTARQTLADDLAQALAANSDAVLQICGPDPAGKEWAIAIAVQGTGRPLFAMSASALPGPAPELLGMAAAWTRDLQLVDGLLLIDADTGFDTSRLITFAEAMPGRLILSAAEATALPRRIAIRFDMERPTSAEQAPLWRSALGPLADKLNGSLARLAAHFPITPELMNTVASELAVAPDDADLDEAAWDACRRRARPRMDDLAQRIDGSAHWDDIILPPAQMDAIRAISAQVRQRARVYEDWGFGRQASGRGLGVSALFSGPSGAGKTMAAEVLGNALSLDVYRIDLSSVVSKWIGETEKNLRRVFDAADEGCAILLFDEADALFGKRSEVKDSHDRHANVEVSYLLQRLETYRGLAILTTNLRSNIDDAFLRRLRFIVDFTFPDLPERRRIWERAFPEDCPTERLDHTLLAQLNVVGGSIRNIAMNAAFFAADGDRSVSMGDVLASARLEYGKSGRSMTGPELRGWPK